MLFKEYYVPVHPYPEIYFLKQRGFFSEFHSLPSVFRPHSVLGNQNLTVSKSGDFWKRLLLTCVWTGENEGFWIRWWHWECSPRDASLFICGLFTAIQPTLLQYIKVGKNWRLLPDEIKIHTRDRFGWGGKRNKISSERGAMERRAGKARCKAIIITSVSFLENNN